MKDVTQSTVAYQYADEEAKLRYRRALDQAKLVLDNPFRQSSLGRSSSDGSRGSSSSSGWCQEKTNPLSSQCREGRRQTTSFS